MRVLVVLLCMVAAVAVARVPRDHHHRHPSVADARKQAVGDYDPIAVAHDFINLGNPTQDCDSFGKLFLPTAVLHSPGVPDASGTEQIVASCQQDISQINPIVNFQTLNLNVTSWNVEKRTAFVWYINGVRTSDSQAVQAPVISCLFQDRNGIIETAWSFYDDNLVTDRENVPPFNSSLIVEKYTNFGTKGNSKDPRNCSAWANLFNPDGINQSPGVPPVQGFDDLVAECERRVARWSLYLPSTQLELPVMSWNTEKRVAFQWTLSGITTDGVLHVAPAITMMLMGSDGLIQQSWDWWDNNELPVPTGAFY